MAELQQVEQSSVDSLKMPFRDLAPEIYRQRLVVEGVPLKPIDSESIKLFLKALSGVLGMRALNDPVTHNSEKFGWAGWIHWETSGAHLYAWEKPRLFFSVDIYTCAQFSPEDAIEFTRRFFEASDVTSRAI